MDNAVETMKPVEPLNPFEAMNRRLMTIFGALVFLASFFVYFKTVAPTTSFWDCGEFIASSYILGVIHPPGAPLYLLIGRLMTMLPFFKDIGLRVNMFTVFISAATVFFTFLIIVQLIRRWRGNARNWEDAWIMYGSAAFGALSFAFTDSHWFNAVEAEVYGFSIFFTALVIWLALYWEERSEKPKSMLLIFFIFYLFGLATGVHLLNILTFPFVMMIAFFHHNQTVRNLLLLLAVQALLPLTVYILFFQYDPAHMGMRMLEHQDKAWNFLKIFGGIWLVVTLAFMYNYDKKAFAAWWVLPVLGMIGYSTYLVIYIRAGMHPPINENDPSTWQGMMDYLGRKQYGQESMLLTFMHRKAEFWHYQIQMMYTRYFGWQFIGQGTTLDYNDRIVEIISFRGLYGIPFFVGILGAVHHFKRDWKRALAVLVLFIMTGYAIIIYLNQPDPQPRERDYSYVGSFFAFALWIGIGMAGALESIFEKYKELKKWWDKGANISVFKESTEKVKNSLSTFGMIVIYLFLYYMSRTQESMNPTLIITSLLVLLLIIGIVMVLFILFYSDAYALYFIFKNKDAASKDQVVKLFKKVSVTVIALLLVVAVPVNLIAFNYKTHDRTGEYVAYDYSYNILETCEPDAIVFTNGDNDTFPLWFLQEVYKIRKDVRVVNLSLLNTAWYIYQLRDEEPKVTLHMSNKAIDEVNYIEWETKRVAIPVPGKIRQREMDKFLESTPPTDGWKPDIQDKIAFDLAPTYPEKNPMVLRVQDWMILKILNDNMWQKPVYFAVTVANNNMVNLDKYLRMDGLAFKVMPYAVNDRVDTDVLSANILEKYRYRGINDPDVYLNVNILKLLGNYRSAFMKLAQTYNTQGNKSKAAEVFNAMDKAVPPEVVPYPSELTAMYINNVGMQMGAEIDIEKRVEMVIPNRLMSRQERRETANFYAFGFQMYDRAQEILEQLVKENPNDMRAQSELYNVYKSSGQYTLAIKFLEQWLLRNPDDPSARSEMDEIQRLMADDPAQETVPVFDE
ncbi:DUF2723 domain-containing protein [bacterium]|nr:DUF2723 domain-containing protein [bacterium]